MIFQRQEPYDYSVTYVPIKTQKTRIHFSAKEIQHLTIAAALVIGIGLSLGLLPDFSVFIQGPLELASFTILLTASFFVHEIAHKVTAQRNGLWAEFRLTFLGAVLTMFSIISPFFKIISPGAVMISGLASREKIGKISIAGPITNMALSMMFFLIALLMPQYAFIIVLAAFNAWIALFNLVPFGILDGFKIFRWDKKIWASAFTISTILTIYSYWLIFQII
jgi:Zn-dependent protease